MGRAKSSWAERWDMALIPFMGGAQIGAGHPEAPYAPPTHPTCPVCGASMDIHRIERTADQSHATRLVCP